MAFALTLLSLFTLAGLALAAFSGWALAHAGGGSAAAVRHIAVSVPTVLFSLFTQSMVLFFFIGTGKLLKEAAARRPDPAGRDYILRKVRELKMRTSGIATLAPLSALVSPLFGGPVPTGRPPARPPLGAAVFAILLPVVP